MRRRGFIAGLGLVGCLGSEPGLAGAAEIMVATETGVLLSVDTRSGAVRAEGLTPQFFDIAIDPQGILWGVTGRGMVFRMHPANRTMTPVGSTGSFINALAFDAAGRLFGAGADWIHIIDTVTGHARPLARIAGFASSGDLAWAPGRIFATSQAPGGDVLFAIDPESGQSRRVGGIGHADVYGLAWTGEALIGVTRSRLLLRIDPETGQGTVLAPLELPGAAYGAAARRDMISG